MMGGMLKDVGNFLISGTPPKIRTSGTFLTSDVDVSGIAIYPTSSFSTLSH